MAMGNPGGRPRIHLIANPVAGRNAPDAIRRAENWFRSRGVDLQVTLTGGRGDARRAARESREGYDRVVAAGGDGTLNEVINGLAPSRVPLAFLPLGTTNVFALEAAIPFAVEAACRIALEGEPRSVNLGMADDTRFLLMASTGLDAEAVYGVSAGLKRRVGKAAYLVSALRAFVRQPPRPLEAVLEGGETVPCFGAIVNNGRLYGGRFVVAPAASLEAPELDVCLLLRPGRLGLLRAAAGLAAGRGPATPGVRTFKARRLRLQGPPLPVQLDGDHFGHLPVELAAAPDELRMVLPAAAREPR